MQVLVVEDNPLALLTCRVCLENMGCGVSEAGTCAEAEDIWKTRPFDLIVMDYRLPDGLGTALIERMRVMGYNNDVICLTAETESISQSKRAELRIRSVVMKPLDIASLSAEVEKTGGSMHQDFQRSPSEKEGPENTNEQRKVYKRQIADRERVGKFLVLSLCEGFEHETPDKIIGKSHCKEWIALDMRNIDHLDDRSIAALLRATNKQLECGGRLCLAGISEKLLSQLKKKGVDRSIDLVRDLRSLEPLSRKLSSKSERNAVLGSIVHKQARKNG